MQKGLPQRAFCIGLVVDGRAFGDEQFGVVRLDVECPQINHTIRSIEQGFVPVKVVGRDGDMMFQFAEHRVFGFVGTAGFQMFSKSLCHVLFLRFIIISFPRHVGNGTISQRADEPGAVGTPFDPVVNQPFLFVVIVTDAAAE